MENAEAAILWLASWGDSLQAAFLYQAIDGQRKNARTMVSRGNIEAARGYSAAVRVLERAYLDRFGAHENIRAA